MENEAKYNDEKKSKFLSHMRLCYHHIRNKVSMYCVEQEKKQNYIIILIWPIRNIFLFSGWARFYQTHTYIKISLELLHLLSFGLNQNEEGQKKDRKKVEKKFYDDDNEKQQCLT